MKDKKEYIAYRIRRDIIGRDVYEREELTEKELNKYIKDNVRDFKNIEIFKIKDRIKVDITVDLVEEDK